jgi:hypothetical protein
MSTETEKEAFRRFMNAHEKIVVPVLNYGLPHKNNGLSGGIAPGNLKIVTTWSSVVSFDIRQF